MQPNDDNKTLPIDASRRYKAVLKGVELKVPRQFMLCTFDQANQWARNTAFAGLTREEKQGAFVRISELCAVAVQDIHPAVEDGHFAITEYKPHELVSPDSAAICVPNANSFEGKH